MKQDSPKHVVDLTKPGSWSFIGSWFLFGVCIICMLNAFTETRDDQVLAGLLFCGGMLALIASILLFDRYKREMT